VKKIIYTIILLFSFSLTYAFDIDMDKISVTERSESLIDALDSTYNIEATDFSKEEVVNETVVNLVKSMVNISISDKSTEEKTKEYTKNMYFDNTSGGTTLSGVIFRDTYFKDLQKYNFSDGYIKDIKMVTFNENDILAFVYLSEAKTEDGVYDVVFVYWLKDNDGYKFYYPWFTVDTDLEDYYNERTKKESNGEVIGGTYNALSLKGEDSTTASLEELNRIYENNKGSVVQVTGVSNADTNVYGSGFYISEGIIVTNWSLIQSFLSTSDYIYVNDVNGNTYNVLGIISADTTYDIAILKLDKKAGKAVTFGNSQDLKTDDKLYMINSNINSGFSINYGSFVSMENGHLKNLLLLSSSDAGASLFNKDGEVVAFTTSDSINSELSYANSTDYLIKLQELIKNKDFDKIRYTSLDDFKDDYYLKETNEKEYNKVSSKIWNKFKKVGNLEENINLDLVKSSYKDNVLSLRYKSNALSNIDSLYLVAEFTDELVNEGFTITQNETNKEVYTNNKYKVIIKSDLSYLIILIMEI